jgi:signal transduction histidine kinase
MTRSAPHLFDDSHIAILSLVADQIGHWWGNTLDLRREQADTKRFKALLQGIGQMDDAAIHSLRAARTPDMDALWERALALVEKISPWPEALSIRTVNDAQELQFAATKGEAWKAGGERRRRARVERRYPLAEDYAGTRAVRLHKVIVEAEAGQPEHLRSQLFPDATKLIHAPIVFGNKTLGVLDVRGFGPQAIPANLPLMCELVARQLGLYHNLIEQFRKQREQELELERQNQEQNQVYEDFLHQLRNPLVKATYLAEQAANGGFRPRVDPKQLEAFVRQALQFSESLNHYIALARGEKLVPDIETLNHADLIEKLKQLAAEEACIVPANRGLTFRVEESTFEPFRDKYIDVARDLLDNCLFNLLDNAAKYSFGNSEIIIRGRFSDGNRTMAISVTNRGHKILSADRARLVIRGERGAAAVRSTAGGRGIGLWIVDKFMEAMNGMLRIIPTDGRGQNEFQLIFKYRFGR